MLFVLISTYAAVCRRILPLPYKLISPLYADWVSTWKSPGPVFGAVLDVLNIMFAVPAAVAPLVV